MVTTKIPASDNPEFADEMIEIELRSPWIAGLLAWALPGLGHIYQGRTGKGVLFFVCILGTFFYGMYLGGNKVVYAATDWEQQYRWQYLCQLGVGLPSAPMLIQKGRTAEAGKHPILGDYMRQPKRSVDARSDDSGNQAQQPNELAQWVIEEHPFFELGTVYTVVAGLLNVLVICDAAGGPLIIRTPDKKKPDQAESPPDAEST
ncbi:MAG: DUF6677 family protein [Planctomycetota bacterium]